MFYKTCPGCRELKYRSEFHIYRNRISSRCKSCLEEEHSERLATKHPEYFVWRSMINRCYNDKNSEYPRYGGRGIEVCDRWLESFWNFLDDMKRRPTDKHWIERIDNDGNYEPSNCTWLHRDLQMRNRSDNHFVDYCGKKITIVELSEITKLPYHTLRERSDRGLTGEELIKPIYKPDFSVNDEIEYKGETHTLNEWSEILKISQSCLFHRHKRGLSGDELFSTPKEKEILYQYGGSLLTLSEISEITNISKYTLINRIKKQGLSIEEAVWKPVAKTFNVDGKEMTLSQISDKTGIEFSTLSYRARNGKTGKDLIKIPTRKQN